MHRLSLAALLGAALFLLPACDSGYLDDNAALLPGQESPASLQQVVGPQQLEASVARDLAALRRATAPFHRFEVAQDAGWAAQLSPCVEVPGLGGMGYHYGNPTLLDDADLDVTQPEVLLYEPQRNGRLRLVAVEYVIPFAFLPPTAPAPVLFGEHFHANTTLGLWALHVWVWQHNPSGLFADFNPTVTCAHAP